MITQVVIFLSSFTYVQNNNILSDSLSQNNKEYYDLFAIDLQQDKQTVTQQILNQLSTSGFLLLTNVPNYKEDELLEHQKWLFSLSNEEKSKLYSNHHNSNNTNNYRGFSPFIPNNPSHKQLFEIGLDLDLVSEKEKTFQLHEQTPYPQCERGQKMKQFMSEHYQVMLNLGIQIMRHIADAFQLDSNYFDKWFEKDTLSTLRMIHYLPRASNQVNQDQLDNEQMKFTTPIHTDSGFLTLLSTFGFSGLQVEIDGSYRSIRPMKNSIVVNLGDMLSRITNYKLKATNHRVVDIGIDRYSSPFFFEPHYTAKIPSSLMKEQENKEEFIYGDWLIEKMMQFGEYEKFKKIQNQS